MTRLAITFVKDLLEIFLKIRFVYFLTPWNRSGSKWSLTRTKTVEGELLECHRAKTFKGSAGTTLDHLTNIPYRY